MESSIANYLNGKFDPIVLIKTDEKPKCVKGPKDAHGGCVMSFVAQTVSKREPTFFGRENELVPAFIQVLDGAVVLKTIVKKHFRQYSCHVVLIQQIIKKNI